MLAIIPASLSSACRAISHGNMARRKRQHPLPHLAVFAAYVTPSHPANPHKSRLGGKNRSCKKSKSGKNGNVDHPSQLCRCISPYPLWHASPPPCPSASSASSAVHFSPFLLIPLCPSVSSVVVLVLVLRRSLTPFRPSTYTDPRFLQRRCDAAPPPYLSAPNARAPRPHRERQAIPVQQNLRIPGPTPIPPQVAEALARPMINHRGPEFAAILARVTERLQHFFQTSQPVLGFPSSGSGAMEAAIVNCFSPGDPVLAVSIGVFG